MEASPLLELTDISKSYTLGKTKFQVLKSITTFFHSGCFSVIAGPSGSGKSTLLNVLGCLDTPDQGNYMLNNRTINYHNKKELATTRKNNFGFVFQSFNLIPVLTAIENVELPMTLHAFTKKETREKSEEILHLVGLGHRLHNKPGELSGGEQQRVAIARAIVSKPKVVFADEPTANLDRKNTKNIVALMKKLNAEYNISFVFASHDEAVIQAAKELYILENGRLQFKKVV